MSSKADRDAGKPVVFIAHRETECAECGTGIDHREMFQIDGSKHLCLECADLAHLVFLPSGDTALTRRATKHSTLSAVVLAFSKSRKRNERQGTLVEEKALARAEEECLGDADARAKQRGRDALRREKQDARYVWDFAARIKELFPGCPDEERGRIAAHACEKHSGRVGRSAAAKELDARYVTLAVRAHIRHEHTRYDELLMACWDRRDARLEIAGEVDEVVARWQK